MEKKYKITVKGYVQGVGYRYFCRRKAEEYNIRGYVKNNFNGDVELEAEGDLSLIKDFIKELKIGPSNASVKDVIIEELDSNFEHSDFKIY